MAESNGPGQYNFNTFITSFVSGVESSVRTTSDIISRDNPLSRPSKHNSDPFSSGTVNKLDLSKTLTVQTGIIAETNPFWGWYSVRSYNTNSTILCNLISDCPQTPMGARRIGSLQPHTKVYFVSNPYSPFGVILGVSPEVMSDVGNILAESITMASGHTIVSEPTNNIVTAIDKSALGDFSRGSAIDSTLVGERGWICETGSAVFVDPFMSFIKADENCGFWAFHLDQLARMHGHNIQIRSSGYEQEHFDDNGESVGYVGTTPYIWEGLGALSFGTATAIPHDPIEEQISKPYLGAADVVESDQEDRQVPYHRLQMYTGYLGQGFRHILRLPPEGGSGINTINGETGEIVWEQHLALDGNFHIRSSQGITIAHSPLYNPPVRQARIENEESGDTRNNYRFSGILGAGAQHKLSDTPIDAQTFPARALCSDDDTAYAFAWRNDHPFKYHENDFREVDQPEKEEQPAYGVLTGQWYIDPPQSVTKKVDHRYSADYNKLMSYFKILPDGTIIIAGPNGEEIRMVGGSIEISCPGDIQLRPGRNLITLAGRTVALRAKKDIDIASTEADVRLKAEENFLALAGNGKQKGKLIIENKFEDDQGIVLKSAGPINHLAEKAIYIRSGAGGDSSNIILDAGADQGVIATASQSMVSFISGTSISQHFGADGSYSDSNVFSKTSNIFGSGVYSTEGMACLGGMACRENFISAEGHIGTAKAKDAMGLVGDLNQDAGNGQTYAQLADAQLEKIQEAEDEVNSKATEIFDMAFKLPYRESGRIGDADPAGGWGKYAFYFKSTGEYKADGYTLYESRWQQRSRMFGGSAETWTEKPVIYQEEPTYPYPGKEAWTEGEGFKEVDLLFYDLEPDPKIEDKKNPGTETGKAPDGGYTIIG
jgi:hypothetical protein